MKNYDAFIRGIWKDNPVLVQVLGMCPTLAVTNSVENALGMSFATAFVLICSSTIIALIKKMFATEVRIMGYIVVIAAFVTLTDIIMKAKFFELSKSLGPFIPLIVVNCIILGRAEAFASKNGVIASICDAVGNSIGFLLAMVVLGSMRELLGSGSWLGFDFVGTLRGFVETSMPSVLPMFDQWTTPWVVMVLAPGAFFGLAILIAIKRTIDSKTDSKTR